MSFWLEYGSQEARDLVAFADELAQTPAGRPGVCFGPLNNPRTLEPLYRQARAAGNAIVEPHGYLLDREPHTKRSRDHFPWLAQTPRPQAQPQWEQWMQEGLDHQLDTRLHGDAGAPSFIITPSPSMQASRGPELNLVLDAATAVRSRVSADRDCWLGVTVDRTYLREDQHLTRLLNAMIQTGADGFVFRSQHTWLPPVDDRLYLEGLREVVETCADNGIRIFLPSSGWLGWLAMGWGAWGFSGGMSASSWADRLPAPMTRPQQPPLPYFEPQLLRSVPWRIHEQLVNESGYQPCACPECAQMGDSHNLPLAKRHQIRHASQEAASLTAVPVADRRRLVADRLDTAIAFRDSLSTVLTMRILASHLDRWRRLMQ